MRRKQVERLLSNRDRDHAKDRASLLGVIREQNDRIMHLAGKPWTQAPADERPPAEPKEVGPVRYTASPERFPDSYPE